MKRKIRDFKKMNKMTRNKKKILTLYELLLHFPNLFIYSSCVYEIFFLSLIVQDPKVIKWNSLDWFQINNYLSCFGLLSAIECIPNHKKSWLEIHMKNKIKKNLKFNFIIYIYMFWRNCKCVLFINPSTIL